MTSHLNAMIWLEKKMILRWFKLIMFLLSDNGKDIAQEYCNWQYVVFDVVPPSAKESMWQDAHKIVYCYM